MAAAAAEAAAAAAAALQTLPANVAVPVDDGACTHLRGLRVPADVALAATDGSRVALGALRGRVVIYAYPRTGVPGQPPLAADWDAIPGARGCTPQSCAFRDEHAALRAAGAAAVFGLSTQDSAYQQEAVARLHLPFSLLSDKEEKLTRALQLPMLPAERVGGQHLLRRFTMVLRDGVVEHVMYPVFPPQENAADVVAWLRAHRDTIESSSVA